MKQCLSAVFLLLLSLALRLPNITFPRGPVWDEVHNGHVINSYINGSFYFDVHPPGVRLLFAFLAKTAGYDGSQDFNDYHLPYAHPSLFLLRGFNTIAGSLIPVLVFSTTLKASGSLSAALLIGILAAFDNALITVSRLILLDPLLLLGTAFLIFAVVRILTNEQAHVDFASTILLSLGVTFSICAKYAGILTCGWATVVILLSLLYHCLKQGFRPLVIGCVKLAVFAVVLPGLIYIGSYYQHIQLLSKDGTGSVFLSPGFKATLKGSEMADLPFMPQNIAYGSKVTLKNANPGCCYLHSHAYYLPPGITTRKKKTQQVTGYLQPDDLNEWSFEFFDSPEKRKRDVGQLVAHGDIVRLRHDKTNSYLAAFHDESTVTKLTFLVGGIPDSHHLDEDSFWAVQIAEEPTELVTLWKSRIRLFNFAHECYLAVTLEQLPKWGWKQAEIACVSETSKLPRLWIVEEIITDGLANHEMLQSKSLEHLHPSITERIMELHTAIVAVTDRIGLQSGDGSAPLDWILVQGEQEIYQTKSVVIKIQGNRAVWTFAAACLGFAPILAIFAAVAHSAGDSRKAPPRSTRLIVIIFLLFVGWAVHYIPYFFLRRTLYGHHYLPAFIFSATLLGCVTAFLIRCIPALLRWLLALAMLGAAMVCYAAQFKDTYGVDVEEILKMPSGHTEL